VLAALITSTTTQTVTSYITLTGTVQTTHYVTFKEVSSVQTVTETTYPTKGVTKVQVSTLTTVMHPIVVTSVSSVVTCPQLGLACIGATRTVTVTYYVPSTAYVMGYTLSTVYGTTTSQYATNVPTTLFSTSAATYIFATSQVVTLTDTQTLTSVSEQAFSETLSQNLWFFLVLGAAVLVALAFMLGRRAR